MVCSVDTMKKVREGLLAEMSALPEGTGMYLPDGRSVDLAKALSRKHLSLIKDPEGLYKALSDRKKTVSSPFHKTIIQELGEEVTVVDNGKEKSFYLVGSNTVRNSVAPGGIDVNLVLANKQNLADTKTMTIDMSSDTGKPGVDTVNGTIEGVAAAARKAVGVVRGLRTLETRSRERPEAYGYSDVRATLEKMQDSDEVLGSRPVRSAESLIGYEKVEDYKHGDITSMKNLLMRLHTLGGSRADISMLQYYSGLFDKMHQRFFNNVDVYFKKNQVDTVGYVDLKLSMMKIDVAKATNEDVYQTEAEVYTHEVLHTMTAWAFRQNVVSVAKERTKLNELMKIAHNKTTWKDLLLLPEGTATDRDKQHAKDLYKYLFSSVEEFISLGLSNPTVMRHLQAVSVREERADPTTLFGKLYRGFTATLDIVLSRFNLRDQDAVIFQQLHELTFRLAEVNQGHLTALDTMNPLGKMMGLVESSERAISDRILNLLEKIKTKNPQIHVPGEGAGPLEVSKFLLGFTVKVFTNKHYRGYLGIWASAMGMRPGGTVREFLSSMFERDDVFREAERLNLLTNSAEADRNAVIETNSRALRETFKSPLTEAEDSAITTVVLDTNLSHLKFRRGVGKKYEDKDIVRLLTDMDYRKEREGRVKAQIKKLLPKDTERANWVTAQAVGLGYYMATGNSFIRGVTNAKQIVQGFGTIERFPANKALENQLNELATIIALDHVSNTDKKIVSELVKTEREGIHKVMDMYEYYRRESEDTIFRGKPTAMITGHTKEQFDDTIDTEIAPVADKAAMAEKGYTLRFTVKTNSTVEQKVPMAVYTTEAWGRAERAQGTVSIGGTHTRGSKLSEMKFKEDPILGKDIFARDLARVLTDGIALDVAMRNGTFDVTQIEHGLMPLYNNVGQIVDFRYTMNKENKKELFRQNLRATDVLPRSIASVAYQIRTEEMNKESLKAIKDDMRNNWETGTIGKDSYSEYLLVGPGVLDSKGKELFYMLPDEFRAHIMARKDKTMAVREDLAEIYFGGRHLQLSGLPGINILPVVMKNYLNMMQGVWEELVKISKGAILLKMPAILVLNFATNVLHQITSGHIDPKRLLLDYKDSISEVNEYLTNNRKIKKLTYEIAIDTRSLARVKNPKVLEEKIGKKKASLAMLESQIAMNPAKELFDAGLYQSYLEDTQNSTMSETNKIVSGINARMDKLPKPVKAVADIAYMTQNTTWYRASQEILQRSDMITRLVDKKRYLREDAAVVEGKKPLPRWWLERKHSGYPKTKKLEGAEKREFLESSAKLRFHALTDNYINYTLPNGKFEELLNRLGILMFTKYLKRIQKVLGTTALSNPIKTSLMLLAAGNLMDLALVQDSSFVSRVLGPDGDVSLTGLVSMSSPLFHIENVFMPPILKDEMLGGLL